VPIETLNAYRDHGHPEQRLDQKVPEAYQLLNKLGAVGIDLNAVTQRLEAEGVDKFVAAFNRLIASLKEKGAAMQGVHQR